MRDHQTASSHGADDRHKKKQVCWRPGTGVLCVPLFFRYQEFVEQQEDLYLQVENGHIMGNASLHGAEDMQKTGVCYLPLFCSRQYFVEQHQDPDPHVENGRIMGSASLDGAEDRQKTVVLCMPLICRPLGILHL